MHGNSGGGEILNRHLTTIVYKGHEIQILIGDCPFLSVLRHTCELETIGAKFVCCLVYPAVLGYPGDMERIFIDDIDCPLAHRISDKFREKAFAVLEEVRRHVPDWWLEFNMEHCWPIYHYDKLVELSAKNEITIEELRACEVER